MDAKPVFRSPSLTCVPLVLWVTKRTYDYAVALRAVNTIDFMTAESAEIPFEVSPDSHEQNY